MLQNDATAELSYRARCGVGEATANTEKDSEELQFFLARFDLENYTETLQPDQLPSSFELVSAVGSVKSLRELRVESRRTIQNVSALPMPTRFFHQRQCPQRFSVRSRDSLRP
jgi:hypothetical protein